jgi:alkanesulfonate monooxygenase SsuD/methylene tetrahydromethanopterin reductase-like flavin-dependent oxidoreductase (luciferase family)
MARARIALSLMPLETRRDVLIGVAREADRLGYDGYFLPETWAYDTTIVLAEAALRTERITLGTGILGVWNRSAATMAMAAATLAALSGGRFVLGLGASTAQLTEGLHDVAFREPAARMRRVLTQVRALLRGERVPLAAVPHARPLKLNLPPAPEVPIYLAALAAGSIRLAGELADGWIPFMYPLRQVAAGLETLREGHARRADGAALPALCPSVPAVVAATAAEARAGAAWFAAFYLTTMGTLYRQSLVRQGFEAEVQAVLAANTPKFEGAVPHEADALLEELIVFGTPEEARRRLARWHAAGAEMPVLLLRPRMSPDEIALTLDAFRPVLESPKDSGRAS